MSGRCNCVCFSIRTLAQTAPSDDGGRVAGVLARRSGQTHWTDRARELNGRVHSKNGHVVVQGAHVEAAVAHESFDASFDVLHLGVGLDVVVAEANGHSGHVPGIHAV